MEKEKRYRRPTARPGELAVKYGKDDDGLDLYYCHGGEGATSRDSRLLSMAFESADVGLGKTLRKELEERNYDIGTLKFSILKRRGK